MLSKNWIVLGVATGLVVACGGAVSLGDTGSTTGQGQSTGDAAADATAADSAVDCASTADCGPAPKSAAIQCPDGSLGGNTGRCLKTATGCAWEKRECPPAVCFDMAGTLDPTFTKCASPADCVVVTYQRDCCGTERAAGVALANQTTVEKCALDRAAALPKCGCPTGPPVADDGSTDTGFTGSPPSLTCNSSGHCETSFNACGATKCVTGQTCCSGVPFPSPTCFDSGACPISQRKHKKDIAYLTDDDRARLNDELLRFPLATYRYKSEGAEEREHLGFIIDDVAPSPAVSPSGERVDMYGYQTMTVAALQVQARELAALRREIEELKASCGPKKR